VSLAGTGVKCVAKKGAFTDELRALVATRKDAIVEYLRQVVAEQEERRQRADATLRDLASLLERAISLARGQRGRLAVLNDFRTLANHWHAEGNPKLHEIAESVELMLETWARDDALSAGRPGWGFNERERGGNHADK
jgi:hypothetical protein